MFVVEVTVKLITFRQNDFVFTPSNAEYPVNISFLIVNLLFIIMFRDFVIFLDLPNFCF